MSIRYAPFVFLLLATLCGCAGSPPAASSGTLIVVPGVNGDGPWYGNLKRGLREGGVEAAIETFGWGAPGPLFALNFNSKLIHNAAEQRLASHLEKIDASDGGPIVILAHSAGCGVTLGALGRMKGPGRIDRVVLLHPSLSPGYDLSAALGRIQTRLTVFHSDRDTGFLRWRTSSFGTYDGVRTSAAGNRGFDLSNLDEEAREKVNQIPYEARFAAQGNDGGHFAPTSRDFTAQVVAPLLR